MVPSDFEQPHTTSAEAFSRALAEYWTAEGDTELARLATDLCRIAEVLRETVAEQEDDLSSFIYAMY